MHQIRLERIQVDDADGVQADHVTGAFAGIEDELVAVPVHAKQVSVSMEGEIVFRR